MLPAYLSAAFSYSVASTSYLYLTYIIIHVGGGGGRRVQQRYNPQSVRLWVGHPRWMTNPWEAPPKFVDDY